MEPSARALAFCNRILPYLIEQLQWNLEDPDRGTAANFRKGTAPEPSRTLIGNHIESCGNLTWALHRDVAELDVEGTFKFPEFHRDIAPQSFKTCPGSRTLKTSTQPASCSPPSLNLTWKPDRNLSEPELGSGPEPFLKFSGV